MQYKDLPCEFGHLEDYTIMGDSHEIFLRRVYKAIIVNLNNTAVKLKHAAIQNKWGESVPA